jgi:hypothetical protein
MNDLPYLLLGKIRPLEQEVLGEKEAVIRMCLIPIVLEELRRSYADIVAAETAPTKT